MCKRVGSVFELPIQSAELRELAFCRSLMRLPVQGEKAVYVRQGALVRINIQVRH